MIEHTTPVLKWFVINDEHRIKLTPEQVIAAPDHFPAVEHNPVIAEVLTPLNAPDQTQLEVDHDPFDLTRETETETVPDPNVEIAYIETGEGNLSDIEGDSNYHVLWSEAE